MIPHPHRDRWLRRCTSSTSDPDGDAVSLQIDWYVDSGSGYTLVHTGATLDGTLYFEKDDMIYAEVTPSDGTSTGTPISTSAITVANTPPDPEGCLLP